MSCEDSDSAILVMGLNQAIAYDVLEDDGSGSNITGKSVSASATYDGGTVLTPAPTISVTSTNPGKFLVSFTAAQLTTIGVSKNVTITVTLLNGDTTLFDRMVDTAMTAN